MGGIIYWTHTHSSYGPASGPCSRTSPTKHSCSGRGTPLSWQSSSSTLVSVLPNSNESKNTMLTTFSASLPASAKISLWIHSYLRESTKSHCSSDIWRSACGIIKTDWWLGTGCFLLENIISCSLARVFCVWFKRESLSFFVCYKMTSFSIALLQHATLAWGY